MQRYAAPWPAANRHRYNVCRHYIMSYGHAMLRRMHTVCKGMPPLGRPQSGADIMSADIISYATAKYYYLCRPFQFLVRFLLLLKTRMPPNQMVTNTDRRGLKTPVLRIAFLPLPCSLSAFYSLTSALAKQKTGLISRKSF